MKILKQIMLSTLCLFLLGTNALAADGHFCVFDPIGANGPLFNQMKDYQLAALEWGVSLKLTPYTDERVAMEDFKAGQCDAVSVSGMRARQFNAFTGTLDSIGSIPTSEHMKKTLKTLSSPRAAKYMTNNDYEIAGIFPQGPAYLFVNDRSIDTVAEFSGKKMAVLEYDKSQQTLAAGIGLTPVLSSIANMFSKFNNGSVDICPVPVALYESMELHKGLGEKGGIIQFGLTQITIQIIIRPDQFPQGFGQKSREYAFTKFDRSQQLSKDTEQRIPAKYWVNIPDADKESYWEAFRQSRIALRDKGIYDGKMLKFLRQVRCRIDPQNSECSAEDKE